MNVEKREPEAPGASNRLRRVMPPLLKVLLAVFFLNGLLAWDVPAPLETWGSCLRVAPDMLILLGGMILWVQPAAPFRGSVYLPAAAVVMGLRLFHSADTLMPMIFNRAFNLYQDVQRLPDFVSLFWQTRPAAAVTGAIAGGSLVATALTRGVWGSLKVLHDALAVGGASQRTIRLLAALAGCGVLVGHGAGALPGVAGPAILPRVAEEVFFILDLDTIRARHRSEIEAAAERTRQAPSDLAALKGVSVFLFVVESYGSSAFSDPRLAERIVPAAKACETQLQGAGFELASAFLTSPTFGGRSWLAHATLETGILLADQVRYDLLLESDMIPLAEIYNRAGYRTVRAMPGTLWPWPAGAFFRYHRTYIAPDFDYKGPPFSWAPMPDQYVLDWVYRKEIQNASGPLLVEFILSGSHAPWDVQPPYVEEWRRIGDGDVFHHLQPAVFPTSWTELSQAPTAYGASIEHEIRLLSDFIRDFLPEGSLGVILGDHQPCRELIGSDQPWSVPVHVISRNADLVRRFRTIGFRAGMIPDQPAPHPGLESLFRELTEGLSENKKRRIHL